jgi:hypothetical protein
LRTVITSQLPDLCKSNPGRYANVLTFEDPKLLQSVCRWHLAVRYLKTGELTVSCGAVGWMVTGEKYMVSVQYAAYRIIAVQKHSARRARARQCRLPFVDSVNALGRLTASDWSKLNLLSCRPKRIINAREKQTLAARVHEFSRARVQHGYRIIHPMQRGSVPVEVADRLGCQCNVVYDWIHRFNERGFATFEQVSKPNGRAPMVRATRLRELVEVDLSICRNGAWLLGRVGPGWPSVLALSSCCWR